MNEILYNEMKYIMKLKFISENIVLYQLQKCVRNSKNISVFYNNILLNYEIRSICTLI